MLPRMAKNPACICAHAERAWHGAATSLGQQIGIRELFCQALGNRQRIGDGAVFGFEQGYFAGRRMLEQPIAAVSGLVELISSSA
jgi:hypothetical protein